MVLTGVEGQMFIEQILKGGIVKNLKPLDAKETGKRMILWL